MFEGVLEKPAFTSSALHQSNSNAIDLYLYYILNNLNIESLLQLRLYEPLLQHQCSKYIRLFICSVFVPMCSEHVPGPILACKGLCEKVKEDCEETFLTSIGLKWPKELNCSR